ncbi:MAG: PKD domain-containing protein [Chloroflexi bacterium]|nr:MAG: PKD domain-containing protein [Chloroflexota bacterium]
MDMDWGDFDNDGNLDVALATWDTGVTVYRNQGQGQLSKFWQDTSQEAQTVAWADFNGDGYLELAVGGEYTNTISPTPDGGTYSWTGKNYLYRYNSSTNSFTEYDQFDTNDGVWRIAPADFNGDTFPDLAAVNFWGGCTAHLFINDNTGRFNRSDPGSTAQSFCLLDPPYDFSSARTYSTAWGDQDNDGDPDLALGTVIPGSNETWIRVYLNNGGVLTRTNLVNVNVLSPDTSGALPLPLDMAWGDYDGDGDLDLGVVFGYSSFLYPLYGLSNGILQVYRNEGGSFSLFYEDTFDYALTALDWADIDGDGKIELIIAPDNNFPFVYRYTGTTFQMAQSLNVPAAGGVFAIRAVDFDADGDLDVAMTNTEDMSWLFSTYAPFLSPVAKGLVGAFKAYNVDWADIDNDGDFDLLYGTSNNSIVNVNRGDGTFDTSFTFSPNPNAHYVALGDVTGDGYPELAIAQAISSRNMLYQNTSGTFSTLPVWLSGVYDRTTDQMFVDANQDNLGRLDLLVGNNGDPNRLYINQGSMLSTTPSWQSVLPNSTYDVAWGYFDDDILPDLAAADDDNGVHIYRNTGYDGFAVAQTLPVSAARSVAWGDYDGDGDMDLAVGRNNQPNLLYQNTGGSLSLVWTAPVARQTTSLAWGDWNNDGDLDLAVGNYGQPDQVYDNVDSTPDQVNLAWLWQAAENYLTTDVHWVDYDNDGDWDLSLSQEGTLQPNGIYENTFASAAHLVDNFADRLLTPRVASYVHIGGNGLQNRLFSRANLAVSSSLTIPLTITVFDPDTSRLPTTNLSGNQVKVLTYQYSLDGGGLWYPATVTPVLTSFQTSRQGTAYTVQWQAGQDITRNTPNQAVSDDVRFRITVSQENEPLLPYQIAGPVQRVYAAAISPRFRIRNVSCIWPEGAYIVSIQPPSPISVGTKVRFWGAVQQWDYHNSGITYTWNFGDVISDGEFMDHTYTTPGTYVVTMTVTQPPCPNTRPDFVTATVVVTGGSALSTYTVYLPLVQKNGGTAGTSLDTGTSLFPLEVKAGAPSQVTGLRGEAGPAGTTLSWQAVSPPETVLGYRVYRAKIGVTAYERVADLPASVTSFTDDTVGCGYGYFVTAYNSASESYPSTSSFYGPPCE